MPESYASKTLVTFTENYTDIIGEFTDMFTQELSEEMISERTFKFRIEIEQGVTPSRRPVIRMSIQEQKKLKRKLDRIFKKGLIQH